MYDHIFYFFFYIANSGQTEHFIQCHSAKADFCSNPKEYGTELMNKCNQTCKLQPVTFSLISLLFINDLST